MLTFNQIYAGYSDLKVLQGIDLEIKEGEVVALVGSNGAGKTTLLRVISGDILPQSGSLTWFDSDLTRIPAYNRVELGIAHIPQGRGVLATLSVEDNLIMGSYNKRTKSQRSKLLQEVYLRFPILKERAKLLAGTLSGGQQQMLAIGRAMMMKPKLLILDEPSLGLAPIVVDEVFEIIKTMKKEGVSMLIIEQNLVKALSISDRGYVLETGKISLQGKSSDLLHNPAIRQAYLGI